MRKELNLQNECMLYASSHNLFCYHFEATSYQLPNGSYVNSNVPVGWPDLTIISPDGKVMFVELKIKPNKPSKKQLHYLSVLPNAFLCYSLDEFKEAIKILLPPATII